MVNCALCHRALPVFEQFPLVDGTLFLSPSRHDEIEYDVPCHLQGQTWFCGIEWQWFYYESTEISKKTLDVGLIW